SEKELLYKLPLRFKPYHAHTTKGEIVDADDYFAVVPDIFKKHADFIVLACNSYFKQKAENKKLALKARAFDRLPFCPDHRDKVAGKPCRECEIERLQAALAKGDTNE
ncbi:unnamed protein product, partial [marine sediment metagenome]